MSESNPKPSTQTFEQWFNSGGMEEAIMQPGEQSWASLKCDGGPHLGELSEIHPVIPEIGQSAVGQTTKTTLGRPQYETPRRSSAQSSSPINGKPVEVVQTDLL